MQNHNNNSEGICLVIRHGERADNVDHVKMGIKIEQKQDPPLTPLGIQQARETAQFLKQFLNQNNYTNIIIQSSPYLRSMQTAAQTAKLLNIPTIEVNYIVSEWMKSTFFESNPIDTLLLRRFNFYDFQNAQIQKFQELKQQFIDEYLDGMQYTDHTLENSLNLSCENLQEKINEYIQVRESYPETWKDSQNRAYRIQNTYYRLLRDQNKQKNNQKTAILCFTHGGLVKQFAHIIDRERVFDTRGTCGYCGITGMKVLNTKSVPIFGMYDDHISIKKSEENYSSNLDIKNLSEEDKIKIQFGYYSKQQKQESS